jgi:hypothetical protein
MEHVINIKEFNGTWLDEKGKSISYFLSKPVYDEMEYMQKDTGLRVYVMVWDNKERPTEITLQSGDGRTFDFKNYLEKEIVSKEKHEIEKEVQKFIECAIKNNLIKEKK